MGNLDFGMVIQLFLDVVKVSAVASVGILLVFAVSPVLEKRHTVFWRYFLFLCLAIRLALPFDISLPNWAAVVPISVGLEAGAQEGSQEEKRAGTQGEGSQEEKRAGTQGEGSQEEKRAGTQGEGSQEGMAARMQGEDRFRGAKEGAQETASQERIAFGMERADPQEERETRLQADAQYAKRESSQPRGGFFAKGSEWLWWLAPCWAVGMAVYWAWQIGCYGIFLYKVRKEKVFFGKKGHLPVYTSKAVLTPMLTGVWRPQILLPAGEYDAKQLEYILGHEFAHYKRKDLWVRLLLAAARAVHWFNPLVAMMERRAVRDMEFLCDSQAVKGLTKEEKKQYGRTLLAFADSRGSRRLVLCTSGLSRGGEELKERFSNLFSRPKRKGILVAALGLAGLLAVSLFVAFGSSPAVGVAQVAGQPEDAQDQAKAGAKDQAVVNRKEILGAKAQQEVKTASAVVNLSSKMQNEEPVVPPSEPEPNIVADQAEISMENAAEEIKNLCSTKAENLVYVKKGHQGSEIYKNQDKDRYGFDWAGNLVYYQSSMDLYVYGAAKTTVEECQEAADYYLSFLVEDPSYYRLDARYYTSEKHCYKFRYMHDVQGMHSEDMIQIWIHDLNRNLVYYKNPMSGAFQEMDGVAVDEEKILQKALELFSQQHQQEGELINPTLEDIMVKQICKRTEKGEIGYEVFFSVANEEICGCETIQFVPFHSVI